MKHVLYGKCVKCGKTYDAVPDLTNCECGGILDIVYDYDYIRTCLLYTSGRRWAAVWM